MARSYEKYAKRVSGHAAEKEAATKTRSGAGKPPRCFVPRSAEKINFVRGPETFSLRRFCRPVRSVFPQGHNAAQARRKRPPPPPHIYKGSAARRQAPPGFPARTAPSSLARAAPGLGRDERGGGIWRQGEGRAIFAPPEGRKRPPATAGTDARTGPAGGRSGRKRDTHHLL